MYNEMHIKALQEAIEAMKKAGEVFKEYCTNECENCPLSEFCDWQGAIAYTDDDLTEEVLDQFVEFHDAWETAKDQQTFKEVTGIDPAWYCFNEDRTQGDF